MSLVIRFPGGSSHFGTCGPALGIHDDSPIFLKPFHRAPHGIDMRIKFLRDFWNGAFPFVIHQRQHFGIQWPIAYWTTCPGVRRDVDSTSAGGFFRSVLERKVCGFEDVAFGFSRSMSSHNGSDDTLQLTDVTGPRLTLQKALQVSTNSECGQTPISGSFIRELLCQKSDIARSFLQRRDSDDVNCEAIVKVFSESSFINHFLKITVGSCYDSCIDVDGLCAADADDLTFFENTEELGLHAERQLADFIKEKSTSVYGLKEAFFPLPSSGECAFFMSEQFRLSDRFTDGGAVDCKKWFRFSTAVKMKSGGDAFFSGPRVTEYQDRNIRRRKNAFHFVEDRSKRRIACHQLMILVVFQCVLHVWSIIEYCSLYPREGYGERKAAESAFRCYLKRQYLTSGRCKVTACSVPMNMAE